jgi:dUTP pyrophosphatase
MGSSIRIEVEVLEGGALPTKAHKTDAGFDLFATSDITLYPGQVIKHPLNIRIKFPEGCWGRVETKSGLGAKGMLCYAGVIDEGYRGVVHVIATNLKFKKNEGNDRIIQQTLDIKGRVTDTKMQWFPFDSEEPIVIKKGEKIAQITMHPHSPEFIVVQVDKIDTATDRGEGGFGSSGPT